MSLISADFKIFVRWQVQEGGAVVVAGFHYKQVAKRFIEAEHAHLVKEEGYEEKDGWYFKQHKGYETNGVRLEIVEGRRA